MRNHSGGSEASVEGHVIVCGLGHVGAAAVSGLRQLGTDVVVIDKDPDPTLREEAERSGATVLQRDMRNHQTLREAGIAGARALVIATSDDTANVHLLFDVLRLQPGLRIVFRLDDAQLARQLDATLPNAIGLTVPELAAPAFAFALGSPAITRALIVGGEHWAVAEVDRREQRIEIKAGEPLLVLEVRTPSAATALPPSVPPDAVHVTVAGPWDAVLQALGVARPWPHWQPGGWRRVAAALRGVRPALWAVAGIALLLLITNALLFAHLLHLPLADALYFVTTTLTTVGSGDTTLFKQATFVKLYASALMLLGALMTAVLYALLTEHVIGHRLERLLAARPLPPHGHVIVCGLGTVGFHVVTVLRRLGAPVAVIDQRAESVLAQRVRAMGVPVLAGNAAVAGTLEEARVGAASSVVVVTSDDLTNLGIALAVRQANPQQHVILRLFDFGLAARVRTSLGMPATLSAPALAAPAIAAHAAFGAQALDSIVLAGQPYVVWTLTVEAASPPATVGQLLQPTQRALLLHRRDGSLTLPAADVALEEGDTLVVLQAVDAISLAHQSGGPV
ncbi:MAG TPA: NAD-binding protein [Chloroflexota bacterium]